jgi:BirA family biotin operon repressor/biotin-[acetyl-CoA-carboxylase] ligase
MTAQWAHQLDMEWVRSRLPGRRIEWHQTIESTMPEAARLAAAGCASGTSVVAGEQIAGVGRHQRPWHSEPDSGLYLSVVLRPSLSPDELPLITLALGLATAEAIRNASGIVCDLRWPNDVLVGDKKCAGILTGFDGSAVIAGIGINVNHGQFPPELAGIATSLRMACGRMQSREQLLVELLPAVDTFTAILEQKGKPALLEMFARASSYVQGRRVQVDRGDSIVRGITAGLTPSGFLVVRDERGQDNVIIAGGVRPCS